MDIKHLFFEDKEAALKGILKVNGKTEEELKKDVEILRTWLNTQKHLPEIPNDHVISNFLLMNKFSIEIAKKKLDMFYTIRGLLPEYYANKHPRLPWMKDIKEALRIIPLPKITDQFLRVGVIQIKDGITENFNFDNYVAYAVNVGHIRLLEDFVHTEIFINDFKYLKPAHITKITPTGLRKFNLLLEKVYNNRISQIHYINCPPYADTFITMVKSFMSPKIASRVHVHKKPDTLLDFIPTRTLPKDYGGEELSLAELEELWDKKFEEYYDRFDDIEKLKVDESQRSAPLENDEILGFYGNFKKLSVD